MIKQPLPEPARPTDAEISILRILWRTGPATVRVVHDALNEDRDREGQVVYTTVLKTMQVMHTKGLLERDDQERSHIYRTAAPAEKTRRRMAADLMQRLFEGSARDLLAHALGGRRLKAGELSEIRELIDELEAKQK